MGRSQAGITENIRAGKVILLVLGLEVSCKISTMKYMWKEVRDAGVDIALGAQGLDSNNGWETKGKRNEEAKESERRSKVNHQVTANMWRVSTLPNVGGAQIV